MKFKAAILTEIESPLIVSEIETTELKVGQVLIKILMSGLCGAQLQELAGLKGNSKFVPHLLGHEGCGIVEEVGPGVTTVKVGDKVVMHWRKGEGIESEFPTYIYKDKKMSSGKVTTISEYSIVSENRITSVPHDTPDELCALLGCGLTTALGVINNEADLKFGESVMIIGTGGVGLNLIQGALLANAHPIYAVDRVENKKDLAISLGATKYINTDIEQVSDVILKEKIDVIIDTTGNVDVIEESLKYLSNNGRFILVGQPKPGKTIEISNAHSLFDGSGKIIKATQGGKTNPTEDIPRYVKLQKSGKLSVDKLVTHYFDLEQINEAFELLKSGTAGRIMIKNK
jgi:S-(hydroxymethyl)glutathione dehydrogenase/alcohol dehydrogenase